MLGFASIYPTYVNFGKWKRKEITNPKQNSKTNVEMDIVWSLV